MNLEEADWKAPLDFLWISWVGFMGDLGDFKGIFLLRDHVNSETRVLRIVFLDSDIDVHI